MNSETPKEKFRYRDFGLINFKQILETSLNPRDLVATCLTCKNFDEKTEACSAANGQRPPARVIAFGCPAYHDNDDIPF